jgi:uncharacterized protein (DUF362 family)
VTKTTDRAAGIKSLIDKMVSASDFRGKRVALKANYNSSDEFPASTHIDTLTTIVKWLKDDAKASKTVLAERSGMGDTREVLENRGVFDLSRKLGFEVVVLDELGKDSWKRFEPEGSHWKRGFLFAKPFLEADGIVQTCCLKSHGFGGYFTMSLKNSVGMVAKIDPTDNYPYMGELHSSKFQRIMIAEINLAYKPDFIIMDGIRAFTTGGPHQGTTVEPGILVGGEDRIAVDAVGVAVLRKYGTTREVSKGKIMELEQLSRAADLEIGISSTDEIDLVPINEESEKTVEEIRGKLHATSRIGTLTI